MGRGWFAAGWVAAGGGDPPATHPDGNGNKGNNGNGNKGDGNEPVSARLAPNQRAQGSHMPFGAPLSANPPHSDEKIIFIYDVFPNCSILYFFWGEEAKTQKDLGNL